MPMSGGTRLLRARRKDCNVKPNRRLDRKSSRGMLYENEELRMRTITINAEVEQGQHALKKLKRENEQLRREMWSLRDEYDKMEKLLRKKETDEDSDRENSESNNASQTDESDDEKFPVGKGANQLETNPDLEGAESYLKPTNFGNEANVRTFDGLSVIDEQTEETQTESPLGCESSSRGNSTNRTFNSPIQMYDEACNAAAYGFDPAAVFPMKPIAKRKGTYIYTNGRVPDTWDAGCDTYETRPSSPYPYNGSFQDSYQKRFRVLQNLTPYPAATQSDTSTGWLFPDPGKVPQLPAYNMYGGNADFDSNYLAEKPEEQETCSGIQSEFDYNLVQDRTGPDVFVTDGFPQTIDPELPPEEISTAKGDRKEYLGEGDEREIDNIDAEIDKLKISKRAEKDPKSKTMTRLTKSNMSRNGSAQIPKDSHETLDSGKLTIDEAAGANDNEISKHVQPLVLCQNSHDRDVREPALPEPQAKFSSASDMPQGEKSVGSKYQTKLTVTLKAPAVKADGKVPEKPTPGHGSAFPLRTFQPQLRYGMRPEYSVRFQTFPCPGYQQQPGARMSLMNGRGCQPVANQFASGRKPLSGSLPRLSEVDTETGLDPSHIPVDRMEKDLDDSQCEETLSLPPVQPMAKAVKIPPVPPPRTSSCPKPIIPMAPTGVIASHQKAFRKGKPILYATIFDQKAEPMAYNPLLLSQPIATSSPTISLRATKFGQNSSSENLYFPRFRKESFYDESSTEDLSRHKLNFNRAENAPKLNKSISSPSFGSFRNARQRHCEDVNTSLENIPGKRIPEAMSLSEKYEKKTVKGHGQNNVSVSSSSGIESPVKNGRRKRRVSIQFKKKQTQTEGKPLSSDYRGKDSSDGMRKNSVPGILSAKGIERQKMKGKSEETDATTSERERTNSVSSRTSSLMAGSGRRKLSISSNRTYFNDEKIPWCGCWGNGCV